MVDIEWYINTEKGKVFGNQEICGSGRRYVRDVYIGLSDEEKAMKELLERMSIQYNVELRIYDVKQRRHYYRAFLKGIRETPIVIVGRERLTGEVTEEQLTKVIREQMNG